MREKWPYLPANDMMLLNHTCDHVTTSQAPTLHVSNILTCNWHVLTVSVSVVVTSGVCFLVLPFTMTLCWIRLSAHHMHHLYMSYSLNSTSSHNDRNIFIP